MACSRISGLYVAVAVVINTTGLGADSAVWREQDGAAVTYLDEDAVWNVVDAEGRRLGVQLAEAAVARRPSSLHAADARHHRRRLATGSVVMATTGVVRCRRSTRLSGLRFGVDVRLCMHAATQSNRQLLPSQLSLN